MKHLFKNMNIGLSQEKEEVIRYIFYGIGSIIHAFVLSFSLTYVMITSGGIGIYLAIVLFSFCSFYWFYVFMKIGKFIKAI